ncbi:general secretion pathway protein GspD [Aromatoleum toluolicum]|uniref:General secretion pathway protein GspD n=1 Tax=Aromatoleum toluolicum TaxID=90060 RepID=A0ABX1NC39_9RHOO|nr:secretin N-terminal domain-containing protein [Aromatoleum toluolicum]NMF96824.1 general secretion pathway protein GspD [Aromatoleum toluolicum]
MPASGASCSAAPARSGLPLAGALRRILLPAISVLLLAACATNAALEQSRRDFAAGDRVGALLRLEQAVKQDPENLELRSYYVRQRDQVVTEKLSVAEKAHAAGKLDEAATLYRDVQRIDPENARARLGLEDVQRARRRAERLGQARAALAAGDAAMAGRIARGVYAEAPGDRAARELVLELDERAERASKPRAESLQGAMAKPVTLEFRDSPLRVVFEALSRASGLNFVFDKDVRADSRVTLFVRENSVDEVLRLLSATQGIERKLLNANTVLIYPVTTAKQREHVELVTRSFYLANAEAKAAQTLIKQLVKSRDVFIDEKLNLLVMKDTPEAVRMAERLVATLDVPEPEVMLELEVLEVSRNKLLDLGIDFPDQIGYGLLTPDVPSTIGFVNGVPVPGTTQLGGKLLDGNIDLRHNRKELVPFIANPGAVLRLRSEDGDSRMLANPRIRVRNRDKAKVHIGDKLPVFTTTSTANVGVSASVSYLDVGLKLEVEPSVYRDDEVGIKLSLEVSSIVKEVPGPSSSLAYQVGSRSASTSLRLRNGETQVLAGLINDEERSSAQRLPGLGNLPMVGRLFSAQRDSNNKSEIALLITPRIVRNVLPPVALLAEMPAGTESNIGAEPLRIGPTAPRSLGLVGDSRAPVAPGASPAALPRPAPEERPAAAEAPEAKEEPEAPEVALIIPETARRGESANVIVRVSGAVGATSADVTIAYDANRLEVDGAMTPGTAQLPVSLNGGRADLVVRLRAKPDASGVATMVVTGMKLRRETGDEDVALSAGGTVRIVE